MGNVPGPARLLESIEGLLPRALAGKGCGVNLDKYEQRLRQLPCVVGVVTGQGCACEELHHAGATTDRDDWNQIPVCREHHQGASGIHGLRRRGFEARYKTTEMKLLALTRKLYAKEFE